MLSQKGLCSTFIDFFGFGAYQQQHTKPRCGLTCLWPVHRSRAISQEARMLGICHLHPLGTTRPCRRGAATRLPPVALLQFVRPLQVMQSCMTRPPLLRASAGDLTFNPEKDTLIGADNQEITLNSPYGEELPNKGFDPGGHLCVRQMKSTIWWGWGWKCGCGGPPKRPHRS